SPEFEKVLEWAGKVSTTKVRANADTPEDAAKAREFKAVGIGLVRTEHMFFKADRIAIVREMIMSGDEQARRKAVDSLLPFQREDFIGIFTAMHGFPVTIRLLDPPLHEFLPKYKEVLEEYTRLDALGINPARHQELGAIRARIEALQEANPMLGHRGCRLGITFPEIYEMQVRAIMEAACEVAKRGVRVEPPEIMIPLTGTVEEMKLTREMTERVARQTVSDMGVKVGHSVGTMIEVPRAALIADELAQHAEFVSFGTNDLSQMTVGYRRDFHGVYVPVPTPFRGDQVATDRLKANLAKWNATDLAGYVVLGSTGEFPMLSEAERDAVLVAAREAIPRGKAFLAGTGANSTLHTIRQTKRAAEIGADAAIVITPHYFTKGFAQAGAQVRHYVAV